MPTYKKVLLAILLVVGGLALYANRADTVQRERWAAVQEKARCVAIHDHKTRERTEVTHEDALALWREGLVDIEGNEVWMEFRGKRRRIPAEKAEDAEFRGWRFVCP